jgi:uncharacterized protein (TIGR01370 family)
MRLIKIFFYLFPTFLVSNFISGDMKKSTVLVCYGKLKPESIKGYHYVILESKHYLPSNIRVIKSQNEKVFAYISLGEVNAHAPHYAKLKNHTLGKNEIWNSYYLNLKSDKTKAVLMTIVDDLFNKGYDGLFLDNIDNFTIHGPQKDQKDELVELLKMIREKYPKKQFIQNAGLDLISETDPYVNAIAIESIATSYSFKSKKYQLRDKAQFEILMDRLEKVNKEYKVPVILIEYADSAVLTNQVLERIKPSKFDYFIGNIDLQTLPKFKQ